LDDVVLLAGGLGGGEVGAEADDDGGAFAGGGFDGDLAAVGGGDAFADGEAEAGALDVVGADVAGVEGEGLAEALGDGRINSFAGVGDAEFDEIGRDYGRGARATGVTGDGDGAAWGVLAGVVDEVDD